MEADRNGAFEVSKGFLQTGQIKYTIQRVKHILELRNSQKVEMNTVYPNVHTQKMSKEWFIHSQSKLIKS